MMLSSKKFRKRIDQHWMIVLASVMIMVSVLGFNSLSVGSSATGKCDINSPLEGAFTMATRIRTMTQNVVKTQAYIERGPITITSDFQLNNSGFPGNGTINDPIRIEGYNIAASSGDNLIFIQDTTYYFLINNCLLNGMNISNYGIYFYNVRYGTIRNNAIYHNNLDGIWLESSNNNSIINNTVNDNSWTGIKLGLSSNNNNISNNTVYSNTEYGIWLGEGGACNHNKVDNNTVFNNNWGEIDLDNSHNNTLTKNECFDSTGAAISLQGSHDNEIVYNTIHHNGLGFYIGGSENSSILNNTIYENQEQGISLIDESNNNYLAYNTINNNGASGIALTNSKGSKISKNIIFQNNIGIFLEISSYFNIIMNNSITDNDGEGGIFIFGQSDNNIVSSNTFSNNIGFGAFIAWSSDNNIVKWNNFIDNGEFPQAQDTGLNNIFAFNYWNEQTSPDSDVDGFVDNPYAIKYTTFQDQFPLTSPYSVNITDALTEPLLLAPQGGEIYTGVEGIQWLPAIDSRGHNVTYNINYSLDNGITWEIIVTDLKVTNYQWNTSTLTDGNYLIKITATCSEKLTTDDISGGTISLHNKLSPPTLLFPNGGETVKGIVTIRWAESNDVFNHYVIYMVYYSPNNGITWILIKSGITSTSYNWDTSPITSGSSFLIKVVATCSESIESEDVSDGWFYVHYLSEPKITSSLNGTTLKGVTTIRWLPSFDSLGLSITYSIFYSVDNGTTWILIIEGLAANSYIWNTTNVPDGSNYLIKVVATSSDGFTIESIPEGSFNVHNAPPSPLNFTFFVIGLAIFAIFPEIYLGRKFSRSLSRKKVEKGVETT